MRPDDDQHSLNDPVAASMRWHAAGPDTDNPPWASGDEDDEESPDTRDAGDDDAGDDDLAAGDADEGRPGTELEVPGGMVAMPRPPKRTGVFLDADDLREHVGGLLRAFLGGYEVDMWGNYTFTHEGARVFVTVGMSPIGPQVGVFSITNLEIDLTPPLAGFLLTTNHKLGFGAFSYDPENRAIWLRHTLLGTMLDGPELQSAVIAVASTAAYFDDRIRDQFGGRAFHDAPEDVQKRAKPPEARDQQPPATRAPNASGYL